MQPSEDNSDGIREPLVIRLPGSVDRIYQRFTDDSKPLNHDSKGYLRRSNKGNQINADEYSGRTGWVFDPETMQPDQN